MNVPKHLVDPKAAEKPIDYKWSDRVEGNLLDADADTKPVLSKAIGKISAKAAYAFGVACAEWIVVRLSRQTDVSDALLRTEAAWAATLDPLYAHLPEPSVPGRDTPDAASDPVRIAMMLLSDMHGHYVAGRVDHLYLDVLILALLAEHVAGRNPVFKRWVPDVLKRAHTQYPKSAKPVSKEQSVAREVFFPEAPDKATLASSSTNLRAATKAAKNPYLTTAARKN